MTSHEIGPQLARAPDNSDSLHVRDILNWLPLWARLAHNQNAYHEALLSYRKSLSAK